MRIFSLICHNGLGHYKRSIEVLSALQQKVPNCQITVACEGWQLFKMKNWEVSQQFWDQKINHIDGIVAPGIRWERDPLKYKGGELINWHRKLKLLKDLQEAELVISDNLPQILHYRADAILMGSFFWSDILQEAYPDLNEVQEFVEEERVLLEKYVPPTICVGDIVMDGVVDKARAIKMPWFCNRVKNLPGCINGGKIKILLSGGATESITDMIPVLAKLLVQTEKFEVFLPENIKNNIEPHSNIHSFDFSDEQFLNLNVVLCRPGIGTLTDCVHYSIPVVAFYETENIEMVHNASRLESLGIGIDINPILTPEQAIQKIIDYCTSDNYKNVKKKFLSLADNGVEETADWLIKCYQQRLYTN